MGLESVAALSIGTAALGGAATLSGAQSTNKAIRASAQATNQSLGITEGQIARREIADRRRVIQRSRIAEGRARVSAAERGTGFGGSFIRSLTSNDASTALDLDTVRANAGSTRARARVTVAQRLAELDSRLRSPGLSFLTGGLQGAAQGLQIGSSIGSFV